MAAQIEVNKNLKSLHSFGIEVFTKYFAIFHSLEDLQEILILIDQKKILHKFVLGGGTNVLFTKPFAGIILQNKIVGYKIVDENKENILLEIGAGSNWSAFVDYCVQKNWYGIENLSLIPGTVGAAPIQNIGAYGTEFKDCCSYVIGYDLEINKVRKIDHKDCHFSYRNSIFKSNLKDTFIITQVGVRLSKKNLLNISYPGIQHELKKMNIETPNLISLSQAIKNIRNAKLPNPLEIGNAGSFFKNPIIDSNQLKYIQSKIPNIQSYIQENGNFKISAAALIENGGWKNYKNNQVGCYEKQCLVLINLGKATGEEVLELANNIIESVYQQFKVKLEPEVNIINC